jgi:hypothetical protein
MQLTLNELTYVGSLIQDHGDMSFFKNVKVPLRGHEQQSLEAKGLFKEGRLSGPLQEAALVMAKANKTARAVMRVSNGVIEKGVFTLGDLQVLIETAGNEIAISFLEDLKNVRYDISDHTGLSMAQHTNMSVMLDPNPLLLLLSIVDWIRRDALLGYVGLSKKEEMLESELFLYLEKPIENSLAGLMAKFYGLEPVCVDDFEKHKGVLIEKGLIALSEGAIQFDQELLLFATHFLLPDTQVVLEAFDGRDPELVVTASNIIICAGIKDIIAFNATSEGVEMMTISSAELVSRAEAFLKCPDLK